MATEAEIDRMVVRLLGDGTGYEHMLQQAEAATKQTAAQINKSGKQIERFRRRLDSVGRGFRRMGQRMRSLGTKMSLGITAPLTGFGALSTREFAQFDQAMTESTSIMDVTEGQIDSMRKSAMELSGSGELLQGPERLAKSYFFLASAGKDAEQSMALLPKVSRFATAGAFDMAKATDLLTDAQSALGMTMKDSREDAAQLARVSDVLVKANTLANASVEQFATSLTAKSGASLKSFNKDVEEGVAVLAAMADQGIKAELSGNALDRMIRLLSKSAQDNAEAHERLGFSVFDASGSMRNLGDIVGNLEDILRGMSDEQKVATLSMLGFEARVQQVILPLLGTSEAIKEYEKELRNAKGTTDEVANEQMKSFSNQLQVLKNRLSVAGVEIGEVLAPMVLKLSDALQTGIEWFRGLSDTTRRVIVVTGVLVGVLGPLVIILGFAASAIGTLISFLAALITPITAVIAGVVALGAAVITMSGTWEEAKDAAKSFFQKTKGFISNFGENMSALWEFLKANWANLLTDLVKMWITAITNWIHNILVGVKIVVRIYMALMGFFINIWKKIFTVDFLKWVLKGIAAVAKKFTEFANFAWQKVKGIFTGQGGPDLGSFLDQMKSDFDRGAEDMNPIKTISNIVKEESKNLRVPLDGFESSIKEAPALNLKVKPKMEDKDIEEATKTIAMAQPDVLGPARAPQPGENKQLQRDVAASVKAAKKLEASDIQDRQQRVREAVAAAKTAQNTGRTSIQSVPQGQPARMEPQQRSTAKTRDEEHLRNIATGIKQLVEIGRAQLEEEGIELKSSDLKG